MTAKVRFTKKRESGMIGTDVTAYLKEDYRE